MADRPDSPAPASPPRRRRAPLALLLLGGAGGVVLVLLGSAWLARNSVGERLAVDYLRRKGVPATVRLTRLDAGGVSGALTIGPAGSPTLTVERFEAEFAPWIWAGSKTAPRMTRLVLVRPRLALRWDGRRLDFGALQPLVDDALRAPPGGGPAPDVRVEDGHVTLATPYGPLSAQAAGDLPAGRLGRLDLRLAPATLRLPGGAVEALAGTLAVRAAGADALSLQGRFTARAISSGGVQTEGATLVADGVMPYRTGVRDPFAGRAGLHAALDVRSARTAAAALEGLTARVALSGDVTAGAAPAFTGDGTLDAKAAGVSVGGGRLHDATLNLALTHLAATSRSVAARGRAAFAVAGGALAMGGERVALGVLHVSAVGEADAATGGVRASATVSLAGSGGVAPAAASRLASRLAPGTYGADLRPALARVLAKTTVAAPAVALSVRDGRWSARLAAPARATGAGGAALTLAALGGGAAATGEGAQASGALRADLSGGGFPTVHLAVPTWSAEAGGVRATFAGEAAGSAGPLRDARLSLAGALRADGGGARVAASRCGDFAFASFTGDKGEPLATQAEGHVCPLPGAPLLTFAGARIRVAAGVRDLALAAPPAKIAVAQGDADARLMLAGTAMSGDVQVSGALTRDTDSPRRFNPLVVSGPATLAHEVWTARMAVALAKPAHPLGAMRLTQDRRSGAGTLTLDAPHQVFAPDGLQPAAVLPSLAALATEVSGAADVTMALGWRGEATSAHVHVLATGIQAKTAAGLVKGGRTDLTITSLDPMAAAPDQVFTADRLETVVPLTSIRVVYGLGKDLAVLKSASATLAGGRVTLDPMTVGLLPGSTLTGVVRADGVSLGGLLDAVNLSKAVQIEAKLQGALPFSLGPAGLHLTDGRLAADGPGRLTLKREALTGVAAAGGTPDAPAGAQPGAVQDFAFQALENLAFTELDAEVGSRPSGRLGVVFHIKGRHDPPVAQDARVGLIPLLRGKAFDRPIPLPKGTQVNLTLDSSLNVDDLLAAYAGLSKAPGSAQVQP